MRRPLTGGIANTLPPGQEAARKRWRGESISTSITVAYYWTPPSECPRAQASPSSLRNPTPREKGKGKGLMDRPFPEPQFVAARRAFHNVMVKPALRWDWNHRDGSEGSSGRRRWAAWAGVLLASFCRCVFVVATGKGEETCDMDQ